jgi:drug/metabolite transporter (DMT)-like permease
MAQKPDPHIMPAAAADSGDRPGLAIALLLMAMAAFVTMDGLAKSLAGQGLAPELIVLWRYALVSVVLLPVVARQWPQRPFRTSRPGLHIVRGVLLVASAALFIYAIRVLPLETSTAISFMSPLYVTALSIPFLGEKVGIRRWMAVLIGLAGVLTIIRPWADSFHPAMLMPVMSSFCWACGLIITRKMRGAEPPFTILIWSTVSGFAAIIPLGLIDWHMPDESQLIKLLAIAVCHLIGQYLTIRAFMLASASILAPFSYSTIIWATLIGAVFFHSLPDAPTVAGTAILFAAGIYVWHRERRLARKVTVPGGASISEAAAAPPPDRPR